MQSSHHFSLTLRKQALHQLLTYIQTTFKRKLVKCNIQYVYNEQQTASGRKFKAFHLQLSYLKLVYYIQYQCFAFLCFVIMKLNANFLMEVQNKLIPSNFVVRTYVKTKVSNSRSKLVNVHEYMQIISTSIRRHSYQVVMNDIHGKQTQRKV